MSTDTEQVTISQAAYDHLRVQLSILKDDLHHALEKNRKLEEGSAALTKLDMLEPFLQLSTRQKAAWFTLTQEHQAKQKEQINHLTALLSRVLPVAQSFAGASHLTEGFRPQHNEWDELAEAIKAAVDQHIYNGEDGGKE